MYAIKKGRVYVSRPGEASSYTPYIRQAQRFATYELAMAAKCGDEYVVNVAEEVHR